MAIDIVDNQLNILEMRTRMPFKYGIATLTALPHLFVTVETDINGARVKGVAADGLPPKWFTKDPDKPFGTEIEEMLDVVRHAAAASRALDPASSVFTFWQQLYQVQQQWATQDTSYPPLLWGFGVTLVERALIDAFCRASGATFARAVRDNLFGMRLGDIHDELADAAPVDLLPASPLRELAVRHTIGLSDPLVEADLCNEDRLDDGLPQTLEEAVRDYGLTHFKIKIRGEHEADLARLNRLARVIDGTAAAGYRFTLDANEQFESVDRFRAFWDAAATDSHIRLFLEHLLFVEQPFHRAVALSDQIGSALLDWPGRPPIIIDESDDELHSLETALERGYVGTSHKNCKGVFKGIANRCLIEARRRAAPDTPYTMSAEDLANLGPVALMQDLAVVATLGLDHAERNGHHYFRGLSMVPQDLQEDVLQSHPDLYHRHGDGYPTLTIERGRIALGSVVDAPFGVACDIDATCFQDAAHWDAGAITDS